MKLIARPLLAAALALAPAMAAHAQPAPAAAPPAGAASAATAASMAGVTEKDRLGAQFVHILLDASGVDLGRKIAESGDFDQAFKAVKGRPEWPGMMRAAIVEEVARAMPQIEVIFAQRLFADFSIAELRAGVAFAATPGGRELVAAGARGQSMNQARLSPGARKAAAALGATRDGRAFLSRFGAVNYKKVVDASLPIARIVLPRAMVAFAEQARIAEAGRPQAAAATEAERLGGELSHILFAVGDIGTTMKSEFAAFSPELDGSRFPADWAPLMREAAAEEMTADLPMLESLFGRALSRHFTVEELRAGVELFRGPVGDDMLASMTAERAGKPRTPPSQADMKVINAFMKTPAGAGFMHKLSTLADVRPDEDLQEFLIVFVPRVLGRFGDKVLADQAAMAAVS